MTTPKATTVILSIVTLALLQAAPGPCEQSWVPLAQSAKEAKPTAIVHTSTDRETVVQFHLAGFSVEQIWEAGEVYQSLRLPGYFTTNEIGKPQLPSIAELIQIPGASNMRAEVVDSVVVVLKGYRVHPFQRPLLEGEQRGSFDIDRPLYTQDAFYPARTVALDEPMIWRDLRVAALHVNPIKHNPVSGELTVYASLTVRVSFFGRSDINALGARSRLVRADHDKMYRSRVLNYSPSLLQVDEDAAEGGRQDYDYLIIAVDRFVDEMAPLVTFKATQGIVAQVDSLSTIGTTSNDIKDHITQEYQDHNIAYVLLVGDITDLPAHRYYQPYNILSDYYYALLSGSDLVAEIAIGRFSATLESEVANMVDKTIDYESSNSADWRKKVLLVAHEEGSSLFNNAKYQLCKHNISTATYRIKDPEFTKVYGAASGTNQNIISAIDAGRFVVNYRGHGKEDCWSSWNLAGEDFSTGDVASLNNGFMTPVVFSIACLTNKLDYGANCLGETFTKAEDAAVAFLGATREGGTTANDTYDQQLFAEVFDEGNNRIGNASNTAMLKVLTDHANDPYNFDQRNAKMYLWLGDPSLPVPVDDVSIDYFWLVAIDTSSCMYEPGGLEDAKLWAIEKVQAALASPNDQVALASFAGGPWPSELTLLLDWSRDESRIIQRIQQLTRNCGPFLADAACSAADKLIADVPEPRARHLVLATCGEEFYSSGQCSGLPDPAPDTFWCDDPNSWHCKVWTKLIDSATVHVGKFGDVWLATEEYGEVPEHMRLKQSTSDLFLKALADSTGGEYYDVEGYICGNGVLEPGEQCEDGYPCGGTDRDDIEAPCIDCLCDMTAVQPRNTAPEVLLHYNWPNPFNPRTTILFELARPQSVTLGIYSMSGERVRTLASGFRGAGRHEEIWTGRDDNGKVVASGTYILRFEADGRVLNKKMLLVR